MRHARLGAAWAIAIGVGLGHVATVRAALPQRQPMAQRKDEVPCRGCLLHLPATAPGPGGWPLVVALHGDGGTPAQLIDQLRAEADRRGFAVLALACPQQLGCDRRSFWQWGGAPSFITQEVDALLATPSGPERPRPERTGEGTRTARIDRQRVYLLAWSGGASYLTDVMAQLPSRFAAVALLGGGMPSRQAGACARCLVPIYYVLGERNPLAALAHAARDALTACGHPLRWVSLPSADHAGEWSALRHGQLAATLAFFAAHELSCPQEALPVGSAAH